MIIGIPRFLDNDDNTRLYEYGFLLHYMDHLRYNRTETELALKSTLLIPKVKTLFDLKMKMIEWANQNKYFAFTQENNKYSMNTHHVKILSCINDEEKELKNDNDIKNLNNELLSIYVIFEKKS